MINDRYQSDYFQIGSKSLVTRIKKEAFEDLSYVLSNETKVPDFSLDPLNPLLVSECYRNYSDKDLLRRFCNYEEEAFNAIYKKYEKGIYHYILKTLDSKNKDKVEDVMQQTFMALIAIQTKGYNELYDNNYLRNFLYRVAENKTIDCIKNNPDLLDSIGEKEEKALILTEEADTQLHLKTLLGKIDKYSETLEKSLKDVAALLSQGYEAEDIAEILEVNRRTIDVRIVRLRDKLRAFVIKSSTEGEVSRLTKQDKEKDQSTSNNKPEIGLKGLIKHLFFGR